MSCLKDVEKAIYDSIFTEYIENRPTFRRVGLNTIEITQQAKNKSNTNPRAQAMEILKSKLRQIAIANNGHVIARFNDTDPYSPVSATLRINPNYVQYVYNTQLKSEQKQDDLGAVAGVGVNTNATINAPSYVAPTVGYFEKFIQHKQGLLEDYERRLALVKKEQNSKGVTAARLKELNTMQRKLNEEIEGSTVGTKKRGLKLEIAELRRKGNTLAVGYYVERDLARLKILASSDNIEELNEGQKIIDFYKLAATWTFPEEWHNPFFLKEDVYLEDPSGRLDANGNVLLTNDFKLSDQDREQYEEWAKKAEDFYQEEITKKKKEAATRIVNENASIIKTYGKDRFTFGELIAEGKGMKDTSWADMWSMDITNGIFSKNGTIPSAMHSELTHIMTTEEAIARGFAERVDKLNPTVLQKLAALGKTLKNLGIDGSTQGVYNIFLERNANNQLTGGSTYKYNSAYENERAKAKNRFWTDFNNARLIPDNEVTRKQQAFKDAFKKKREWTRNNQIMVRFNAIPEIMAEPEFARYAPNFATPTDAAAHKAKLISVIGQREYDKQVKEQMRLLRKYGQDKDSMVDELMEQQGITDPLLLSQQNNAEMNRWVKGHSPFYGLNDYYEVKFDDGNTTGNYQEYNVLVPRKNKAKIAINPNKKVYDFTDTPDKMDTNYYNEDFEKYIEADDDLYAFHELLTEAMEYVKESAPPDISSKLAVNFLATLDKTSAEIITDKNEATNVLRRAVPAFRQWWDKFRQSLGVVKQKNISSERLDINGRAPYEVNDSFLRDNQSAIDDMVFIEKTKFLRVYQKTATLGKFKTLDLNSFNVPSLIMLADYLELEVSLADIKAGRIDAIRNRVGDNVQIMKVINDYATHEVVKNNSFDLAKMIKHFTSAAAMYSARTQALPRLELLKTYYDNIKKVQTNNLSMPIFNKESKRNQAEGNRAYGIMQMKNWWERVVLDNYGPKHAGVFHMGEDITPKHEKEIKDIIQQLKNVDLTKVQREALERRRNRLIHGDVVKLVDKNIYSKEEFKKFAEIEALLRDSGYIGQTEAELKQAIADASAAISDQFNPPANMAQAVADKAKLVEQERLLRIQTGLGKLRTGTALLDIFLGAVRTLRLGWNLSSALTNMVEGWSSNMLVAATGEYMKPEEIYYGYHVAKLSMIKNMTFGAKRLQSALAIRNRMLMDMFDVLMDSKNELQKSSVKTFSDKFEKFNPHALNQRVEFVNQSAMMVGMARSTMIDDGKGNTSNLWDAYDVNRKLKPQWRTLENIENWEELTGSKYKVFRDNLREAIVLGHGNYDELRGMMLKSSSGGKAIAMFKTWLPQQIYWRFAVEQDDVQSGMKGFRGKYWSYGAGSGALHGLAVGAALAGPLGAGIGFLAGGAFFGAFGSESINPILQLVVSTKVMAKKMLGMPINTILSRQLIGTSGEEFDKWVGKGKHRKFTQADANALKANMSDIAIQLVWLALMLLAKHFFWDDDDDQKSKKRKAHNLLVNRFMQLSSQASLYSNPVEGHKSIIGNVAILAYLGEVYKETIALGKFMTGRDEIGTGINTGESRLWNQTKKTFLPGVFKDNPIGQIIEGKIPTLGFESQTEQQFQPSAWDDWFKLHITDTRRELRSKMEAEGASEREIREELNIEAPTKKFLKKNNITRKEWMDANK